MSSVDLFENFSVSSKQWKQHIQFLLNGKDYNENCVWKSHQQISISPFYNQETTKKITPLIKTNTQQIIQINSSHFEKVDFSSSTAFYHIFPYTLKTQNELFTKNIQAKCFIPFLDNQTLLAPKNCILLFDPIADLSKNGKYKNNKNSDFSFWKTITEKQKSFCIDARFLAQSGANISQQIAYTMAIYNEYLQLFSNSSDKITLFILLGVHSDFYFEIAKIQTIRKLFKSETKNQNINLQIITEPSTRYQIYSLADSFFNQLMSIWVSQICTIAGSDFIITPYQNNHHCCFEQTQNAYFIENLIELLSKNSMKIYKDIIKNKGYLFQLKEHIIQRKIKESARETSMFLTENFEKKQFECQPIKRQIKLLFEPIL